MKEFIEVDPILDHDVRKRDLNHPYASPFNVKKIAYKSMHSLRLLMQFSLVLCVARNFASDALDSLVQ